MSNKAARVNFDQSSPNGILLFRTTSDIICTYGHGMLSLPAVDAHEIYKLRYKGYAIALDVLNSALSGNYVCFGVFQLYQDRALDNALDVALKLILTVSLDDIVSFPKLSKSYFAFLELLFKNHIAAVLQLDTGILLQLMNAVHEGLQNSDPTLSSQCATTIDHIATFFFSNRDKDKADINALKMHLAAQPSLFSSLTATLFNLLLFGSPANHYAVMRPMLSLMLASPASYGEYQRALTANQSPANQVQLADAFGKLTADVSASLESANRDRFTQKLTAFRTTARSFLTL